MKRRILAFLLVLLLTTALAPAALAVGLEPVALKELVYQSMAYVGFGRMLPFLLAANEVLGEREREEFSRLKVIKAQKEKQAEEA